MTLHERALLPGAVSPDLTTNCTLEDYAAAKNLPVSFLRELKLETIPNPFDPRRLALRIPYRDADGMVVRDRIRAGLRLPTVVTNECSGIKAARVKAQFSMASNAFRPAANR